MSINVLTPENVIIMLMRRSEDEDVFQKLSSSRLLIRTARKSLPFYVANNKWPLM
jgi:hypothetical protein